MLTMNLESYFEYVDREAASWATLGNPSQELLEAELARSSPALLEALKCRVATLSPEDRIRAAPYLEIGHFVGKKEDERMALFLLLFDIQHKLRRISLQRRFQTYAADQPIFHGSDLLEQVRTRLDSKGEGRLELVDAASLKSQQNSEIFERMGRFYELDSYLDPRIVALSLQTFPTSRLFVRLDPYKTYGTCPRMRLQEATLIPANPHWWQNLAIRDNQKEGCSYLLEDDPLTPNDIRPFWEYRVMGLRRLDVVAKRRDGNLSMMLEELTEEVSDGLLIGRCIHLDSDAAPGSHVRDAVLNHLDLAINVYDGDAIKARMASNLAHGKVVESATFRTHLFRIEKIPLAAVLLFASVFFRSSVLLAEWTKDQFRSRI